MAENKTKPTDLDPVAVCEAVEHKTRREDALVLLDLFGRITGEKPIVWGDGLAGTVHNPTAQTTGTSTGILGFGQYHYKYDTGREGTFMRSGFSARKANLVMYIMGGCKAHPDLMEKLGKHKSSVSCLYVTRLANIDMAVLEKLITADWKLLAKRYP